jgi:hypothetical protein
MPRSEHSPRLVKLCRRQALDLSPQRFQYDVDRLLHVLDKTVSEERNSATPRSTAMTPPILQTYSVIGGEAERNLRTFLGP